MNAFQREVARGRLAMVLAGMSVAAVAGAWPLERLDLTGTQPSPTPGELLAPYTTLRWKDDCVPVRYAMNTTIDPIPNPQNADMLPLAEAVAGIRQAMQLWQKIPTSFADQRLDDTITNFQFPKLDFVNEVTFVSPEPKGYWAATYAYWFPTDVTLNDGDDIDGDGDSDVSAGVQQCGDADGDGDRELPPGFYPAGTLFETDVHFNSYQIQFAVDPAEINDFDFSDSSTVDLIGIAAHELGHAIGLDHTMLTEIGGRDGTGATMATGNFGGVGGRLARRTLHSDDEAWVSYLYPEGTARKGIRALQRGDIPFRKRYALVKGRVVDATGRPVAGSSLYARDAHGRVVSAAVGGHVQLSYNPETNTASWLPGQLGIIDADYVLPVPKGIYRLGMEAVDGYPWCGCDNTTAFGGLLAYGKYYREEYWSGPFESGAEKQFGAALPVFAFAETRDIDFVIDDNTVLVDLNSWDGWGFGVADSMVAVRVPRDRVLSLDQGKGVLVQAALFASNQFEAPQIARFDMAMITTGRVLADGSARIDLRRPLVRESPFIAQDQDDGPLYVPDAEALGDFILHRMSPRDDIFLVAAFPKETLTPLPWMDDWNLPSWVSPLLIFFDEITQGETLPSNAWWSVDKGKTFEYDPYFGVDFELVAMPKP